MKLLSSLFGSPPAKAKTGMPAQQPTTHPTATTVRIIHIRLEVAHLELHGGGSMADLQVEAPFGAATTPDGVLISERPESVEGLQGKPPPICRLAIPEGASVDVQLATGGLTVRDFQGKLRARVLSGGVSVERSAGTFRVVVPGGRSHFENVRGEIDILTSSGPVSARWVDGPIQAVSTGGSMEFQDIDGSLAARTINGRIDASDLRGAARISTRTGAVRVFSACGQLTVRTHSGDIDVDCSIVDHTTLETYKGHVDLKLGPETNVHLEATVGKGVVRTERISPQPGTNRHTLRSTVGLGESRLRLASVSGRITVAGPPPAVRLPLLTTSWRQG